MSLPSTTSTSFQMKQTSLSTLISCLNLTIFTVLFLSETSSSVDPHYEACVPKNCGSQIIKYPFWIKDKQESYCGYPGFELTCQNDHPILQSPGNDYTVEQIFYNNQSLRIYNSAVINSTSGCLPTIGNISLEKDKFRIASDVSYLFLLSNCSSPLPKKLLDYKISCAEQNGKERDLVMFGNNGNLSDALGKCRTDVVVPIELNRSDGIWDYLDVMRRGFVVNWMAGDCRVCDQSGGLCGFDVNGSLHFMCYCPDRPHAVGCKRTRRTNLTLVLGTASAGIGISAILLLCIIRKLGLCKFVVFGKNKTEDCQNFEAFLKNYGPLSSRRYTYSDVKKMTNSFKDKLGQGGYGSVFKGKLENGCLVAVKVLNELKGNGEEFINEVATISKTSHVNIVTLLGFCFEGRNRALIYEFMPNGSLEKFIYNGNSLSYHQLGWESLYQIAVGIARGLEYLHRGCNMRILHFDIKPHNILLDDDFCPKISDFGLAKICPWKESIVSLLGTRGTVGYIAPEVFCRNFGGVSPKSDVYSYGMMVLEMVGGRKNINVVDHTSEIYFPHWIYTRLELDEELGLHGIVNDEENESARKMILVGLWCIQTDPSDRPSMSKVVEMLQGSPESLKIPPKPFLFSPSRSIANSSSTIITL